MMGLYLNTLSYVAPARAGKVGFDLFCRPLRLPINQKQKEFFQSADLFTIDADGHSVQAYRWGRGSKNIVFLHGWQSHTYRWKAYIEALDKEEYTVYAFDAPGHGLSGGSFLTVPFYSQFVGVLAHRLGSLHAVIGHSIGGFTLLYTLHRLPLLPVSKAVIMASPGEVSDFFTVFRDTLGLHERTMELVTDYFVGKYNVGPDHFSTARFAPSLKMPGLIIHDEDDFDAPHHYALPLNKHWQQSRLITTKGFGHNLRSPSVVKNVVDFVNEPVHAPAFQN